MVATHASKEVVWLQRLCSSMGLVQRDTSTYYDIQNAIFFAKNHTHHSKTKHIDVRYQFVRDMVHDRMAFFVKMDTLKNVVDALMNYVGTKKLSWCI